MFLDGHEPDYMDHVDTAGDGGRSYVSERRQTFDLRSQWRTALLGHRCGRKVLTFQTPNTATSQSQPRIELIWYQG